MKTNQIMNNILFICRKVLEKRKEGKTDQEIIHWFTIEIIEYLNVYCTKQEPTNK